MSMLDWVETGALVIVVFLMIGVFRLLYAHTTTLIVQTTAINHQAQKINSLVDVWEPQLAYLESEMDGRIRDMEQMYNALGEVSRLLAYVQETMNTETDEQETED